MSINDPNYAPTVNAFAVVSVSVSSIVSARAAGVGPFRGIFAKTSCTFSITGINGNILPIDNLAKNTVLWIQGAYVSAIATATSQYMII